MDVALRFHLILGLEQDRATRNISVLRRDSRQDGAVAL
jgi:hypothetical protein